MSAPATPSLSALKLALLAKQARATPGPGALLQSEPIAVVGLSCRFPGGADSPASYWRMLRDGVDAITEVPADRWDARALYDPDPAAAGKMSTRWGGFLDRVDGFDPKFFGIAPREAASMDPQQRLLLEVAIEALDDAGVPHDTLAGTSTGVFVALYGNDYGMWHMSHRQGIDAYTVLGTAHCIASGRLSFLLDLQGPSLIVDTGCSSSLVAVHLACQSLRAGECRSALAAGVGLILAPEMTVSLSKWGFMAPDGRCKTFDRRADGFVRGEGCGVVVLKRLADALADGDRVLAVIRGTAVNEDGRSTVLTAPSGPAQEAVIRQALANAQLDASEVTYVEAHGTGTALGDPIELEALASVFGQPADGTPCAVGSVKANIGHLEAAAGMAGLIKTILAIEHGWIPPQPHLQELTPHVSIDGTRLELSPSGRPWPAAADRPRVAGVSSFGFGGTNAHVIVEGPPRLPAAPAVDEPAWILPLSARSPEALAEMASRHAALLRQADRPALRDICFTAAVRRTAYEYRAAVAGTDAETLAEGLAAVGRGEPAWNVGTGRRLSGRRPGPVFVFCGQGPQWWGMARQLLEVDAVFGAAIDEVAAIMDPLSGWALRDELGADETSSRVHETEIAQPAIFAMQVALVAALRARGVEPAAVLGHSVGEIAAAHVAGVLTLDQAVRIAVHRGRVMQRATGHGRMVAVAMPAADAAALLERDAGRLSMAAINAPRSIVLSGKPDAINAAVDELEGRGVNCRLLPVNYAFHSHQMQALVPDLRAVLDDLGPTAAAALPLVSTVSGEPARDEDYTVAYWLRNLVSPVRFAAAIEGLGRLGHDTFLEVGPHPVLAASIRETLGEAPGGLTVIASQHRARPAPVALSAAIGQLFASGQPIDWKRVYSSGRVVSLPAYPWQRQRYWVDPPGERAVQTAANSPLPPADLPGRRVRSPGLPDVVYELEVTRERPAFLAHHRIHDAIVFPAAGYLALVAAAVQHEYGDRRVTLFDTIFEEPLVAESTPLTLQVLLSRQGEQATFRIVSLSDPAADRWTQHAAGRVAFGAPAPDPTVPPAAIEGPIVPTDAHYASLEARGCHFGPLFRRVTGLRASGNSSIADIDATPRERESAEVPLDPTVLDACFQSIQPLLPDGPQTFVPLAVARLSLHGPLTGTVQARARLGTAEPGGHLTADIQVGDGDRVLLSIEGLRLHGLTPERRSLSRAREIEVQTLEWELADMPSGTAQTRHWVVLSDGSAAAMRLQHELEAAGHTVELAAEPGDTALPDVLAVSHRTGPVAMLLLPAQDEATRIDADALTIERRTEQACGRVLAAVKAAVAAGTVTGGLWFVTRAAQAVGRDAAPVDPVQAAILGIARVAANEHPELGCRRIDLEGVASVDEAPLLAAVLAAPGLEPEIAMRHGEWLAPRLVRGASAPLPVDDEDVTPTRVVVATRGSLDNIAFGPAARRAPGPGEVELRVRAVGLNFRDVLNVLGMYPGQAGEPGDECAGVVTAVGDGVTDFHPGDEVVGLAPGCFATHAVAKASMLVRKPPALTFAEAATIPSAFMTASCGLNELAQLRAGETVLIHAAAGGVGLAAVQLARRVGAEVYATAGSNDKRAYLRSIGVRHVMNSRSLDFADELMSATGGRGVDVVLNSLAGDAIRRSLDCLAPGGRFVEIGRTGIWERAQVEAVRPDVDYHVLFLVDVFEKDPGSLRRMLEPLLQDVAGGQLPPLPARTFAFRQTVDAFRYMANARHIGKVVVTQEAPAQRRSAPALRGDRSYLVTGAFGALGWLSVRRCLELGARALVLVGRRGPDAEQVGELELARRAGVSVQIVGADIATPAGDRLVASALKDAPPLAGVIHAAGVIEDAVITEQSAGQLTRTLAPKVAGAWNVHGLATGRDVDFFVLFSAGAALLGPPGQAVYAAANAFLDGLAHHRHALGLPAVAVNWGPWADAGMAGAMADRDRQRFTDRGIGVLAADDGLAALERVMQRAPAAQTAVLPIDWPRYVAAVPSARPLVARLVSGADPDRAEADASEAPAVLLRDALAGVPETSRMGILEAHVRARTLRVLGLPEGYALDPNQGLRDVGLDSLMAVEIRNVLAADVGEPLPATLAFDYPTVAALTNFLARVVLRPREPRPDSDTSSGSPDASDVENLTDEEAMAQLAAELATLEKGEAHGS